MFSAGATFVGSPVAPAFTAAARALVTASNVPRSWAAYPLTVLTRLGMRSWRRFSSTSISDQASWVRLRAEISPLYVRTSQPTIRTRTTIAITQPMSYLLRVRAPRPSRLLKHLLVLVLAHLL